MPAAHWLWLLGAIALFGVALFLSGRSLYLSVWRINRLKAEHNDELKREYKRGEIDGRAHSNMPSPSSDALQEKYEGALRSSSHWESRCNVVEKELERARHVLSLPRAA